MKALTALVAAALLAAYASIPAATSFMPVSEVRVGMVGVGRTVFAGLAAYPTMILETGDTLWLMQTIAHEWVHNWLFLRPLGYSYLDESPVVRTINETVASLAGDELGLQVMRRYYLETLKKKHPDLVEPKPLEEPDLDPIAQPAPQRDPNEFSYNNALYETRVKVEEMLAEARQLKAAGQPAGAEAKIVEAENYMEERRQFISTRTATAFAN